MDTVLAPGAEPETPAPAPGAWVPYAVFGGLSVVAGLVMVVYPDTIAALSIILGLELLLLGALELLEAFDEEEGGTGRTLQVVLALVAIVAGVIVLRRPTETLEVILLAAGIYLVLSGIVLLVRAWADVRQRGFRPLGGLVMLGVGIAILAWPDLSLRTLAVLVGIGLIVRGITALGVAWLLHLVRETPDAAVAR